MLSSLKLRSVKTLLRFPGSCLKLPSRLPLIEELLPAAFRNRGMRLRACVGRSVELCDADDTAADNGGEEEQRGSETQSSERLSSQAFIVTVVRGCGQVGVLLIC